MLLGCRWTVRWRTRGIGSSQTRRVSKGLRPECLPSSAAMGVNCLSLSCQAAHPVLAPARLLHEGREIVRARLPAAGA
eukprot:748272-Hanusia_phi.AAC.3